MAQGLILPARVSSTGARLLLRTGLKPTLFKTQALFIAAMQQKILQISAAYL